MKHIRKKNRKVQKNNGTLPLLQRIHELLDKPAFLHELIDSKFNCVNPSLLSPYLKVYFNYLNARYYFRWYQKEEDLIHLEYANDFIDDMDALARDKRVKISHTWHHFTRAYIKLLLGKLVWDEDRRPHLLKCAQRITERSLQYHPNNQQFIWLQKQLAA